MKATIDRRESLESPMIEPLTQNSLRKSKNIGVVQKTIFNTIRHQQNEEDQEHYKRALGNFIFPPFSNIALF